MSITKIEKQLGAYYPADFKAFMSSIYPAGKITLDILGGSYTLMTNLSEDQVVGEYDDIVSVSQSIAEYKQEDPAYIKLPFARSEQGDRFAYLYFLASPSAEAFPQIYVRDTDMRYFRRLLLSPSFSKLIGSYTDLSTHITANKNEQHHVITKRPLISELVFSVPLPDNTHIHDSQWRRISHLVYKTRKPATKWEIEFYVEICEFTLPDRIDSFTLISMHSHLYYGDHCLESLMHFQNEGEDLQVFFENDLFFMIYYYRLLIVLNGVEQILAHLPDEWKKEEILHLMDQQSLDMICRMPTRQISYCKY